MTAPIIRGLTLWRPWAAAIVHGPKRVENRPWHPPVGYLDRGLWVALHAGRTWDREGALFVAKHWRVEQIDGSSVNHVERDWPWRLAEQGIVGVARVTQALRVEDMADGQRDPWAFGPWCWMLDSVRALPKPIPCRGAQGLWSLSPEALAVLDPYCQEPTA